MNNVRGIRSRRGFNQAISIPKDMPRNILPWAQSVVREIQSLRDDVERLRKLNNEESFRKK